MECQIAAWSKFSVRAKTFIFILWPSVNFISYVLPQVKETLIIFTVVLFLGQKRTALDADAPLSTPQNTHTHTQTREHTHTYIC